jgi:hypothetical protein
MQSFGRFIVQSSREEASSSAKRPFIEKIECFPFHTLRALTDLSQAIIYVTK